MVLNICEIIRKCTWFNGSNHGDVVAGGVKSLFHKLAWSRLQSGRAFKRTIFV